jgi:hypothetical protein
MEVIADSSNTWASNACRYATHKEAEDAGRELMSRWMAVREYRAVESTDAVNYRFDSEAYRGVPL